MCLARVAAGIAADDERLILNRPRDRQRPQMSDARRWPLAHDEEHVHPLHGECPRQLREADVIADYKAAVVSVEPEAAEMIAGREIRMLAHRRKQVRLIILCDAVPRAVKDARRVIDLSAAHIRDAARHKIHAKLRSQPAEFAFHPRAVPLGQYETMKAQSDAPVFLHAVTMQNHTNYNKDNYPDDQRVKVTEAPAGLKASTVGALEDFATGIRVADAMLGRLTDYFSQVEEPVILVFWGDHYNPIDSNYDIYTRSGYASGSSADPRLHQTTLLMWSNYSDRAVDLGTIAAYDISPVMMELFGLRQPAYFQFLGRQLRAAYRANTRGTILEKDGTASNELTPLQQKWSDEHWLLQYDLMFGKGYALSRMGLEELAEGAD